MWKPENGPRGLVTHLDEVEKVMSKKKKKRNKGWGMCRSVETVLFSSKTHQHPVTYLPTRKPAWTRPRSLLIATGALVPSLPQITGCGRSIWLKCLNQLNLTDAQTKTAKNSHLQRKQNYCLSGISIKTKQKKVEKPSRFPLFPHGWLHIAEDMSMKSCSLSARSTIKVDTSG